MQNEGDDVLPSPTYWYPIFEYGKERGEIRGELNNTMMLRWIGAVSLLLLERPELFADDALVEQYVGAFRDTSVAQFGTGVVGHAREPSAERSKVGLTTTNLPRPLLGERGGEEATESGDRSRFDDGHGALPRRLAADRRNGFARFRVAC